MYGIYFPAACIRNFKVDVPFNDPPVRILVVGRFPQDKSNGGPILRQVGVTKRRHSGSCGDDVMTKNVAHPQPLHTIVIRPGAALLRLRGIYTGPHTSFVPQTLAILLIFFCPWHTLSIPNMSSTNETKDKTLTDERKTEAGMAPSQDNQQPVFGILPHPAVSSLGLDTSSVQQ